jgi:hypothetical protein
MNFSYKARRHDIRMWSEIDPQGDFFGEFLDV